MKAAILEAPGRPIFSDIAAPAGDAPIIDVTLAGVNPIDLFLATQPGAGFPRVPGSEGVGRYQGRRVYFSAQVPNGSMAEQAVARPERILDVPQGIDDGMAVLLGIAGLTAALSLTDRARMQPGETVLVLGASGMVGRLAVQLARAWGAGRVIAAARRTDLLADLPADAVVSLDGEDAPDLAASFRAAGAPDVIIDPVWSVPAVAALMAAAPGGRLVQLGHSAGLSVSLAPAFMRGTGAEILGYSSSLASPERRAEVYATLCGLAAAGTLSAPVETIGLSAVAEAWDRQKDSPNAKLCLDVSA